MIRTVIWWST